MFAPLYLALAPALLGDGIAPALAVGPLLAWRIACAFLQAPIGGYLLATGRQSTALKAALAGAVVLVVGCGVAIPRWGLAGAAVSALASEAFKLACYAGALGRAAFCRMSGELVAPLACALAALGLASRLGAGLAATAVAVTTYALLLAMLRVAARTRPVCKELP
jgi:O-antigen/teichoic acid export membrane protein